MGTIAKGFDMDAEQPDNADLQGTLDDTMQQFEELAEVCLEHDACFVSLLARGRGVALAASFRHQHGAESPGSESGRGGGCSCQRMLTHAGGWVLHRRHNGLPHW